MEKFNEPHTTHTEAKAETMDKADPEQATSRRSLEERYHISDQERLDSEMEVNSSGDGWVRYWKKRLAQDLPILPKEIQDFLRQDIAQGGTLPPDRTFIKYVKRRVATTRFKLQKRKAMFDLTQRLRDIDAKKDRTFIEHQETMETRTVFYDQARDTLVAPDHNGIMRDVAFGDVIADYAWGIYYVCDTSVPHNIQRKINKRMAIIQTREKIADVYDHELQLAYADVQQPLHVDLKAINNTLQNLRENPDYLHTRENAIRFACLTGALAERMIGAFLSRIAYNNPELAMRVEKSNALEDTVLKYDFKIFLSKRRGVALEPKDIKREEFVQHKREAGIQLTTVKKKKELEEKAKTVQRGRNILKIYADIIKRNVDDIALVSIPELKTFYRIYLQWRDAGSPSGGPEQYLSRDEKLKIFQAVTKDLINLSADELANLKI